MIVFLTGCSYNFHPTKYVKGKDPNDPANIVAKLLDMKKIGPYPAGCSVSLVNGQVDNGEQVFKKDDPWKFIANYHEWTQFFIDEWTEQLVKRGVNVTPDSPNVIRVSIKKFDWADKVFLIRSELEITIEKAGTNWSRTYNGHARRMDFDYSAAVYQTIAQLLATSEVVEQMRVN